MSGTIRLRTSSMEHVLSKDYHYTVLYKPLPEGGFQVVIPAIPEIISHGETLEEARSMASDALRCYLESALERNEVIPEDISQETVKEEVAVTI